MHHAQANIYFFTTNTGPTQELKNNEGKKNSKKKKYPNMFFYDSGTFRFPHF